MICWRSSSGKAAKVAMLVVAWALFAENSAVVFMQFKPESCGAAQ